LAFLHGDADIDALVDGLLGVGTASTRAKRA